MEHQPKHTPEQKPKLEAYRHLPYTEQLLETLPPPEQAAGIITAMLADETRDQYLEALSRGQHLDAINARLIAYNLIAHAPDDALTGSLRDYFHTGSGNHEALRAEYLPLYLNPEMQEEGRVLLDALGTHLFHTEHPETTHASTDGLSVGVAFTAREDGDRISLTFSFKGRLDGDQFQRHTNRLLDLYGRWGEPFRAWLRLPGIDSLDPLVEDVFISDHIASLEALRREQKERELLGQDAHEHGSPAPTPLRWDAVELAGAIHVFRR